jgi:hypothetical protein
MQRLTPDLLDRLTKLLGMLGSAHDGERAVATRKAHELIRRHGLTWSEVLNATTTSSSYAPPPPLNWRDKLDACEQHKHSLSSLHGCRRRTPYFGNGWIRATTSTSSTPFWPRPLQNGLLAIRSGFWSFLAPVMQKPKPCKPW